MGQGPGRTVTTIHGNAFLGSKVNANPHHASTTMKAALAAAALLLAAACSDASGPAGVVRVRTDASGYRLPGSGSPVSVGFTVRNTGSEPIALPNCARADHNRRRQSGRPVESN